MKNCLILLVLLLPACSLQIKKDKENHTTSIDLVPILPKKD